MKKVLGTMLYILMMCVAYMMLGVFWVGGFFSEKWKRQYHIAKYQLTHT